MPRVKKLKARPGYKLVEVPDETITPEQRSYLDNQSQDEIISAICGIIPENMDPMQCGLGRLNEFLSYFPGNNELDPEGNWIMIKESPPTEYTVPPFSLWFATPWPQAGMLDKKLHRVKVVTPKGSLGLYPFEYVKCESITPFIELIDPKDGFELKFFGNLEGAPKDALFYIRSRGISKVDAFKMLLGEIKTHGVCWIQADRKYAEIYGKEWPHDSKNACL